MNFLRFFSISLYIVSIVGLFFYSFVQVDLGLTLTSHPFWLPYQKAFQEIGYFQRPLSTMLYLTILTGLFASYGLLLFLAMKKLLSVKTVIILALITFCVLVFSYNAFSYDVFNYIFDARIFTFYGDNPYEKRALDYPADYHLGFMRWIHRTYPYGPLWLGISIPLSYAGVQSLLLTLVLFKLLTGICYLGSIGLVKKIMEKIDEKHVAFSMAFFALNPLVIIETLVSSHNDIVMMVFALLSIYLLIIKKKWFGIFSLMFSIVIKFATAFILPIYLYAFFKKNWEKQFDTVMVYTCILMAFAVFLAAYRTQFQPWYLLFVLPFASLIARKDYIFIPTIVLSITSLLNYVPYLYTGNWNDPIPQQIFMVNISGVVVSIFLVLFYRIGRRIIFRPHLIQV